MAYLSFFLQERWLKQDLRLSFEIQCYLQLSHHTAEALFYFLLSTVFCRSHERCPGQHKHKVTCDSSCVTVRVLPFSFWAGWSHQADFTWLKIGIHSFFPLSFFFFFLLLFPFFLTLRKTPDCWNICGSSLFFFSFFSFWHKSLVLLHQLPR